MNTLIAEYEHSCLGVPVSAQGSGLVRAVVDHTADFHVDTMGLRGSLKVQVDGACPALVVTFLPARRYASADTGCDLCPSVCVCLSVTSQ